MRDRTPVMGAVVTLLFVAVVACERKAPGPTECRNFALSMFALRSEDELARASRRELAIRDQIDELTRECLTMPYDRAYVRCLEESGKTGPCRRAFERRRARASEPALSR
jgi:hypothetical protein